MTNTKTTRATQDDLFAGRRSMMKQVHKERTEGPKVTGAAVPISSHACPNCGAVITAQAIVDGFGQPEGWLFWGEQGQRWRKCSGGRDGYTWIHFIVASNNGRKVHRLAWVKSKGE
jgi:hypothetical protein